MRLLFYVSREDSPGPPVIEMNSPGVRLQAWFGQPPGMSIQDLLNPSSHLLGSLGRRHAADDLPFQPLKDEPEVDLLGKVGAGLFQHLDALLGAAQGLGQAAGI